MKKIGLAFLAVLAGGLLVFNLTLRSDVSTSQGVGLSNIRALQASSSEAYCDQSSSSVCTITVYANGMAYTATGTGQPHYNF